MTDITKYWGAPGTGKTTKLADDLNELLNHGYIPEDIVAVTFRKTMALDLKNRLNLGDKARVGTIHSIGLKTGDLLSDGAERVTSESLQAFRHKYLGTHGEGEVIVDNDSCLYDSESNGPLGHFIKAYQHLKNILCGPEDIYKYPGIEELSSMVTDPKSFMSSMWAKYETYKEEENLYDFTDMLFKPYVNQDPLSAGILVVDEFQDLTPLQYNLISQWATDTDVVIIAGDPNQCIYQCYGAQSSFFENHPGNLKTLPTSYRLPRNHWLYAREILKKAGVTYPDIDTAKPDGILKNVSYLRYLDGLNNFRNSTLHLVRCNYMATEIAANLAARGIPFLGKYGWTDFQINLYNGILKTRNNMKLTYEETTAIGDTFPKTPGRPKKINQKAPKGSNTFEQFGEEKCYISPDEHLRNILISDDPLSYSKHKRWKDRASLDYIKIQTALKLHHEIITTPSVGLHTIHGIKGGEADNVFLHTGISKAISKALYQTSYKEDIQTEAQVFYVGATRAKKALYIVNNGTMQYNLPRMVQ